MAGKVTAIGVDLGSYVKRGQMIVRLDDVDSKLRVEQAQAQLDQSKAALRQLKKKSACDRDRILMSTEFRKWSMRGSPSSSPKRICGALKLIESGDVSRSTYDEQKGAA